MTGQPRPRRTRVESLSLPVRTRKVQLSSAEAEVGACALAGRRLIYIRLLIGELFKLPGLPVSHVTDNTAVAPLTENLGVSRRNEHFRRWQNFARYLVTHGYSYMHHCRDPDMYADSLTKVTNLHKFITFQKVFFNIGK